MATAASAAVVAVPATSASAAPVKGLQDQDMTVNNPQLSSSFFTDAKAAKVGMARYNVRWDGRSSAPDAGQVALVRNAIQQGAANGIQTVTLVGNPTGGDFTLTYAGQTTAAIPYNASPAAVRTALEALSNVDPGEALVTGVAGGPYTVSFGGDIASDGIVTLTLDDPTSSANTMNELYQSSMEAAVQRLYDEQDEVTGVVLASAKKTSRLTPMMTSGMISGAATADVIARRSGNR